MRPGYAGHPCRSVYTSKASAIVRPSTPIRDPTQSRRLTGTASDPRPILPQTDLGQVSGHDVVFQSQRLNTQATSGTEQAWQCDSHSPVIRPRSPMPFR